MSFDARSSAQPTNGLWHSANERSRFNRKLERKMAEVKIRLAATARTRWDVMVALQRHEERLRLEVE